MEGMWLRHTKRPVVQSPFRARVEFVLIVADVSSQRTAKTVPPCVVLQPYDGRSAYCAPLLQPPVTGLIHCPTPPSSTTARPSVSHLYAQHKLFLPADSDLSVGSHHTSTSPSKYPGLLPRKHAHSSFGAGSKQKNHSLQDEASGGPPWQQQPAAHDALMPLHATLPALHDPSAEPFTPVPGMVLPISLHMCFEETA